MNEALPQVGRVALESTSSSLQLDASPSQLPTLNGGDISPSNENSPVSRERDTGLLGFSGNLQHRVIHAALHLARSSRTANLCHDLRRVRICHNRRVARLESESVWQIVA
jgi:hypothetical protein